MVVAYGNDRIQVFERGSGRLVQSVEDVRDPMGMCLHNDRLYVACWDSNSIRVFSTPNCRQMEELGRLTAAVKTRTRRRALWILQKIHETYH